MKKWILLSVMFLFSFLMMNCGGPGKDDLALSSSLPEGIQALNSVFEFKFNKNVVPDDSLNRWSNTNYINYEPAIEGKFIWRNNNTLIFSPDGLLSGDVEYKGTINEKELIKVSELSSFYGKKDFSFSTPPFTVQNAVAYYEKIPGTNKAGLTAKIEFSYAVNPDDIKKYIEAEIDGRSSKFNVLTDVDDKVITLSFGEIEESDKDLTAKFTFDKELFSTETKTSIKIKEPYKFTLPRLSELVIQDYEFTFHPVESWITFNTSQEINPVQATRYITVEPKTSYKIVSDKHKLLVKGDFVAGTNYTVRIGKGLKSDLGGTLINDFDAKFFSGTISPNFRFASETGTYMLLSGNKNLLIKSINLSELQVSVSEVFQNNLVQFLNSGRYYDWDYYYSDEENPSSRRKYRYYVGDFGKLIETKKVNVDNQFNKEVDTYFDLTPYLNRERKGFIVVEVSDPVESWRSTSKLVSVSNIGLIVKKNPTGIMVFAVGLDSNEPVKDALITLYSSNNQIMGTGKTDNKGAVLIEDVFQKNPGFTLKVITAEKDGDFNFIPLDDYRVETSRFDVGGKFDSEVAYDAFLYGDRTLYRPGEKIIVTGIVRKLGEPLPEDIPVKIKIINPLGRTSAEVMQKLNSQGSFEYIHQSRQADITGEYRIELYTANNIFLQSYKISLEDFVPERMKVTIEPSKKKSKPGENISFNLSASTFFGPAAAERNYELEINYQSILYTSDKFPDYNFTYIGVDEKLEVSSIFTGVTDDSGKALIPFTIPELKSSGIVRLRSRGAVFDETGRPVYNGSTVLVYPREYFIGLKYTGSYYISPGSQQQMLITAVNKDDKQIKGFKVKVELIRREWHSVLRRHQWSDNVRYVSEANEIVEKSDVVTLGDSPYAYNFSVNKSGDYLIRVSKEGEEGYNQVSFYSYSWITADITSFGVDPEARVEIITDKTVYAPGEKAKILFQAPFSGKMLVTIERNGVYDYQYVDIKNNSASLDLTIEKNYLPNVYISAVLFRKIKDEDLPLLVGHGYANISVESKSNRFDVSISSPSKVRPKTKQTVTVNAGNEKDILVTLAAVDEGILQIKNHISPAPFDFFYAKKALMTETYNFFRDLLPDVMKGKVKAASVGGDAALYDQFEKRLSPFGVRRFKPVALWSGIIKTDSRGDAKITLDIPEFSGELRLMAVAYKGDRFGSAVSRMTVADPVVITPALPRFIGAGDSLIMPVAAFNTTDKEIQLDFSIETKGGITAKEKKSSLKIPSNRERFAYFTLSATNEIGNAEVKVLTTINGEKVEYITDIVVRPLNPFTTESITGIVEADKLVSHTIPNVYYPYNYKSYLTISPFPVSNFAGQLKMLLGYPHGCLEQTVSKAFPQIYLRDLALALDPSILSYGSPVQFVNEAISKASTLQLPDGNFNYWPQGNFVNVWTTVYTMHFLVEAQKAGYAVREEVIQRGMRALNQIARSRDIKNYYFTVGNETQVKRLADKSSLYALYVLALNNRADKSLMDFYKIEKNLLSTDMKYLLAAAYALAGDRQSFNELLPKQFSRINIQRTMDDFDSSIRAYGLIISLLTDVDRNNPQIFQYINVLSERLKNEEWFSTQDAAFAFIGLGKAARQAQEIELEGTITIGDKEYLYKGGNQKFEIDGTGKKVTINLKGKGKSYYAIVSEGIRKDDKRVIRDNNLQVRRTLYDRFGNELSLNQIKQNDLVIVKISLQSSVDNLQNIAITDLLPAGFEIENPRLTEQTQYSFIQSATVPQYLDIRDDRINIYTNFEKNQLQQQFYYLVRAVSSGTFNYPPITAEAMYNPTFSSINGKGVLRIK